jgi:PqqD family protein of HPr-rel-A system
MVSVTSRDSRTLAVWTNFKPKRLTQSRSSYLVECSRTIYVRFGQINVIEVRNVTMDEQQLARKPVVREKIEFRVLDDLSSVAVDPDSGQAHALTAVATAIFERCDGTMTVDEIVAEITDIFDCDGIQARSDVLTFLGELSERGLIDA